MASVQHVQTGPGDPRSPRAKAALGLASAAAVVLLGLVLGGGTSEEEPEASSTTTTRPETTTTRPRTTTSRVTTTSTTLPPGPVLANEVGGSLLAYGGGSWTLIDLDTGVRRDAAQLPGDNPYLAVGVRGGVVLTDFEGEARYYPLPAAGDLPDPVVLGPAEQVFSAGSDDRVWLLEVGQRDSDGVPIEGHARLVDLEGRVLRSFDLPGWEVTSGTSSGLVLGRGGRVYLVDERGPRPVATGSLFAVAGDSLVLLACDDRAECGLQRLVPGRSPTSLDIPARNNAYDVYVIGAADGRFAVASFGYEGEGGGAVLFDAEGRRVGEVDESFGSLAGTPVWLPGTAGLLLPTGGVPSWLHERDGTWVQEELPRLDRLSSEVLVFIPR